MGVRGLTSYIAQNAELYLQPFELHDCDLVIDGDNLACNLYKDVSGCNSAFGGDYDEFYRTVVSFYHLLSECNIRPYTLLDGGYEHRKMRRVEQRLRGKIALVKYLNPNNGRPIFPLMLREVFVDAVRDCGVKLMRCTFEADDEIAILARKLNCPVLSYDSDFYIHNVKYIPLITVTMKVLTKRRTSEVKCKHLAQCKARNMKKCKEVNKGLKIHCPNDCDHVQGDSRNIKYIDCCIYTIENLTSGCKLQKDMLPIFAALLGNDYIDASVFKQFFSQVCTKGIKKKVPKQQRRVVAILRWLKHETKESALEKILSKIKKERRQSLLLQIECAINGYSRENSEAFDYFALGENMNTEEFEEDYKVCAEVHEVAEEGTSEEESIVEGPDLGYEISQEDSDEESSEEHTDIIEGTSHIIDFEEVGPESRGDILLENNKLFPDWFQERIYSARLPRFCVDLKYQSLYINNPQIENFLYPDCNEVALRILQINFYLIHYPVISTLRYLTRQVRVTNVHYRRIAGDGWSYVQFDPSVKDVEPFREVFRPLHLCCDFPEAVQTFPSHLRLYLLAIIYWSNESKHSNVLHFHALVICLVILSTVDSKIVPVRDENVFYKKYKKFILKERAWKTTLESEEKKEEARCAKERLRRGKIQETLEALAPWERIKYISKLECIMVQQNVLKHFQQPKFNRKQHDEFSSSIVHGFSEFQAVVYQMFALNALTNYPFESVKMAEMYNGIFLYNLYVTLRNRTDINYYVRNFILRESSTMFGFYHFVVNWCKPFVKFLRESELGKPNKKNAPKEFGEVQDR